MAQGWPHHIQQSGFELSQRPRARAWLRSMILGVAVGLFTIGTLGAGVAQPAAPDSTPSIPERDRVRLAEAFRLADQVQDRAWAGWSSAPFAVLLVTREHEFLLRHPNPSPDFKRTADDTLLGSPVHYRKRIFPTGMQATFPAVNGLYTVVIGQPEHMSPPQSSGRWVLTVLHEHFHQWQDTRPGTVDAVNALDLARGDSSGMWMLEFPFPYADARVSAAFDSLSRLRAAAVLARGTKNFERSRRTYAEARDRFTRLLQPDDARYLEFQLWKEGVARYTEYLVATLAAKHYEPSARFRALSDYVPFDKIAREVLDDTLTELSNMALARMKRVAVYASGAADALLLDQVRPGWRDAYLRNRFSLRPLFP